jgi:GTP cyclohydrolase I
MDVSKFSQKIIDSEININNVEECIKILEFLGATESHEHLQMVAERIVGNYNELTSCDNTKKK